MTYCLRAIGVPLGTGGTLHRRRCGLGLPLSGMGHGVSFFGSEMCELMSSNQEWSDAEACRNGGCLHVPIPLPYIPRRSLERANFPRAIVLKRHTTTTATSR
jgi:hypothetical protein